MTPQHPQHPQHPHNHAESSDQRRTGRPAASGAQSPGTLICDNCDRIIDPGDAAPGSKLRCPDCGDITVVPGSARNADRAAAAGYPPADGPEVEVLRLRPVMVRAAPIRFTLLILLTLGGAAAAVAFGLVAPLIWAAILGLIAFVTGAIALLCWKVLTFTEGLTVTTKRTIDRHGLLSRKTSEVLHADIRNIRIDQTVLQRLFRVGDLAISSAADDDQEVFMAKVPRPDRVREVIDLYRRL